MNDFLALPTNIPPALVVIIVNFIILVNQISS